MNDVTTGGELTLKTILGFGIPLALLAVAIYFVIKSLRKKYSKK